MSNFTIASECPVIIPCDNIYLNGFLFIPENVEGLVLFAHGSGSSRFSERNNFVAKSLQQKNIATLLFDLLTEEEDKLDQINRELRFNIYLLAARLLAATNWVLTHAELKKLPLGYFGASTGAAAALLAAAQEPNLISAIVSRGGRPDLAGDNLLQVKAPTLFIVGGKDEDVLNLNEQAFKKLNCEKKLTVVPGASHLFEEQNKLEEVSRLAAEWFVTYLIQRL